MHIIGRHVSATYVCARAYVFRPVGQCVSRWVSNTHHARSYTFDYTKSNLRNQFALKSSNIFLPRTEPYNNKLGAVLANCSLSLAIVIPFSVSRERVNRETSLARDWVEETVLVGEVLESIGDDRPYASSPMCRRFVLSLRDSYVHVLVRLTVRRIYGVRERITFAYQFLLHIKVHQRRWTIHQNSIV